MDGKALLKMALDKIDPDKASEILENSGLLFTVGGVNVKFVGGHLEDADGNPVDAAMSSITDVKTEEEVQKLEDNRRSLAEQSGQSQEDFDKDQAARDAEAARFRAAQNPELSTTHTLLGGGVSRTMSPAGAGVNVVGGQVTGDQFGKHENIATAGYGTGAGFATTNVVPGSNLPQDQSQNQPGVRTFARDGERGVNEQGQVDPDEAKRIQDEMVRQSGQPGAPVTRTDSTEGGGNVNAAPESKQ